MALQGHNHGQGGGGGGCSPSASGITILSQFFVMLVFLFYKLFEHYSQTNVHIIKIKPFKLTKYQNAWQIFMPKWVEIKISLFYLCK